MINIDAFKRSFEDLANPAQTGDSFSPDQFNRELPVVIISAIRRHLGLPEEYSPGMPQPKISYEATQMIANELLDLRTPVTLKISEGISELPSDYFYLSSLNYKYPKKQDTYKKMSFDYCCETEEGTKDDKPLNYELQDTPITLMSDAEFNMALGSALRKPTKSRPIARLYGKTSTNIYLIQFAPKFINQADIIYVRKPKVPVWGYTINPLTLLETYNPATSQDIELPESMFDTLRFIMLKRLGVPEREIELYKYGQDLQNKGV